jgi:hypothetical protein
VRLPEALQRGRFLGRLNRVRSDAPTLVLSDENWLGSTPDALAPEPYPRFERILGGLRPLLSAAPVKVFLAIRSMDTFLPSAYAEMLRFHPDQPSFETLAAARREAGGSWLGLIRRLRDFFPDAPLTVWRYEDYAGSPKTFMSAICGCDVGEPPKRTAPSATRTPSAESVRAAESLKLRGLPLREYMAAAQEALKPSASSEKFSPLSLDDKAFFRRRYEEDVDALSRMEGVELIQPAHA